jgi:hypothetical protein
MCPGAQWNMFEVTAWISHESYKSKIDGVRYYFQRYCYHFDMVADDKGPSRDSIEVNVKQIISDDAEIPPFKFSLKK